MKATEIPELRLRNQHIAASACASPHDVVRTLGAMQAQDRAGALWAVALRVKGSTTQAAVEKELKERKIVRTWPMRGTLHFVSREDVHWMLPLLTPRIVKGAAGRMKQLELDDATLRKAGKLFASELRGGGQLTRAAAMELLERHGISVEGQRGYTILWRLCQEGLLCLGVHDEKQQTFVLLEDFVPRPKPRDVDACIADLVLRYFSSHGPATEYDCATWSGLKLSEVRQGLETLGGALEKVVVDGEDHWMGAPRGKGSAPTAFLLPGFDEYLLGYKERGAVLELQHANKVVPGNNGMFLSMMVLDGAIVGTWRRTFKKSGVEIALQPFTKMKARALDAFDGAVEQYGAFHGLPVTCV